MKTPARSSAVLVLAPYAVTKWASADPPPNVVTSDGYCATS